MDPLAIKPSKRRQKAKVSPSPKKYIPEPKARFSGISIPEFPGPQPTEADLPKLLDSYPDYFHFERNSRSLYFTLVYYGERFNSATYGPGYTYWQCAHRYKFKCPALLHVSNDYTEFERRYEHTHGELKIKGKQELLTPRQALPAVFRISWHRSKEINPELESDAILCFDCIVTLEGFFQFKEQCHVNDTFLKTLPPKNSAEVSDASEDDEEPDDEPQDEEPGRVEILYNSEEEGLVEDDDFFEPPPKKASVQPKAEVDTRKSSRVRKPTAKILASPKKVETPIKREPKAIQKPKNVDPPKTSVREPAANELPKLLDSYPDYFHFERGPRSVHYSLIFYGERYNSAIYGSLTTYWQCAHRRKFRCPALVTASNDYTQFERRNEHTHGELKELGEHDLFTPKQALPEVFRICWQKMQERKTKRQQKDQNDKDSGTDEEVEFLEGYEKGSLQEALRKSGVLDSDDDDED